MRMTNEYPTIISFYTDSWEYPQFANDMKNSCKRLGLESYVMERESSGSWISNTRMKPVFIYEALMELKRPVLWVDVDGSILQRPELLKVGYPYDFAARKMPVKKPRTWHVGTMYFNYTNACLDFLREWNLRVDNSIGTDELCLDMMWQENIEQVQNLRIGELPKEYFEMLRQMNNSPSHDTIVCHRASKDHDKMAMKERQRQKQKDKRKNDLR